MARVRLVRGGITLWQVILACSISITHCHDDASPGHHSADPIAQTSLESTPLETDQTGDTHSHLLMLGFELPASSPSEIVLPTSELPSCHKIEPDPVSFKWSNLCVEVGQAKFSQSPHDPLLSVPVGPPSHTQCHTSVFAQRKISGVLRP